MNNFPIGLVDRCSTISVFFDATQLALWEQSPLHRVGIGRMATSTLRALLRRSDVVLYLISPSGMEGDIQFFLDHHPWAHKATFIRLAAENNRDHCRHTKLKKFARIILRQLPSKLQGWIKHICGVRPFKCYELPSPALRQAILPYVRGAQKAVWLSCFQPIPAEVAALPSFIKCVILHDIIPLRLSAKHPFSLSCLELMHQHLDKADIILANSKFTRQDFLSFFPAAEDKVQVALHGGGEHFTATDSAETAAVLRAYGVPPTSPFIVSLATLEPRKGLHHIIKAFEILSEKCESVHLFLVGQKGWNYRKIVHAASANERIHLTGFLADGDIAALLSGCCAFVYVSEYEGFGLPIVEAMSCGAPVIASNSTSLPEVAGDAALYVNPGDSAMIAFCMMRLLTDENLREDLRVRGLARAQNFTWDRFAETLVNGIFSRCNTE